MWRLGEQLGCTASEAAERVTYEEYVEFHAWEMLRKQDRDKTEYYLARIAGLLSGKPRWRIADFLLDFKSRQKEPAKKVSGQELKAAFMRAFGM